MADAKPKKAAAKIIDFGNVKERGQFNPRHVEEGEYFGKFTKVEQTEAKDGEDMWVFTFVAEEIPRATYPYYCKLQENQYFKIKQLAAGVGINVGAKKLKVDPNKLINKRCAVFLEDDEYEGRLKSVISEVLHVSEVTGPVTGESDDDDLEDDEIEEEIEEKPRKKKRRPEPEPEEDEEDEDDEDEEDEEPEPPRRRKAAKKAPAKKASAKKRRVVEEDEDDEELEDDELEIDEL